MKEKTYLDKCRVIDNKPYPRVTAILDVISKGFGYYRWLLSHSQEEADAISKEALDIGSRTHELIDLYNKNISFEVTNEDVRVQKCIENYTNLIKELQYKNLKSEMEVYSNTYNYAGQLDGIGTLKGELCILDIKTSRQIYNTYQLQVEAYRMAYQEMTKETVKQLLIINLKKDGNVIYKIYKPSKKVFKVFLAALDIFNFLYPIELLKEEK